MPKKLVTTASDFLSSSVALRWRSRRPHASKTDLAPELLLHTSDRLCHLVFLVILHSGLHVRASTNSPTAVFPSGADVINSALRSLCHSKRSCFTDSEEQECMDASFVRSCCCFNKPNAACAQSIDVGLHYRDISAELLGNRQMLWRTMGR